MKHVEVNNIFNIPHHISNITRTSMRFPQLKQNKTNEKYVFGNQINAKIISTSLIYTHHRSDGVSPLQTHHCVGPASAPFHLAELSRSHNTTVYIT